MRTETANAERDEKNMFHFRFTVFVGQVYRSAESFGGSKVANYAVISGGNISWYIDVIGGHYRRNIVYVLSEEFMKFGRCIGTETIIGTWLQVDARRRGGSFVS